MPSVHPAMEGGDRYPQYERQGLGSILCGVSSLQPQLFMSDMESPMLSPSVWNHLPFSTPSSYMPHAPFASENQQYFGSSTDFFSSGATSRPSFQDTSYAGTEGSSSLAPRSVDFLQDPSYLDELSSHSIFSSPADSLSDIADAQDFLHADSLSQVPTLWDVNTQPTPVKTQYQAEEEEEEEEAEELGHTETYSDYVPSKSKLGKQHPDRVVETSTLSSVPPPDVTYELALPSSTFDQTLLSALQLEAIVYACQQHEVLLPSGQRAGFLIGDGAGVGKGRTVAGIIFENYLRGRKKSLWFSVSNDLKYDAERDLKDINAAGIPVHALNKIKYGNTATSEGALFATYSALIGESQAGGQHRTRIKQILDWCGENFNGVIVFDECHKAKNASSTKMGKAVLDLQNKLPLARVVYASATGASEPKNMIYMSRLGIWGEGTPFRTFDEFLHAIEKRGVGAMEIVAMDMKVNGMYIARQLSFSGVTFQIEEIPLEEEYKQAYNKAALLWAEALTVFQQAADLIGLESRKSLWGQFWSAHQRFFKYLCIAAKVRRLVALAKQQLAKDKCIVIGLQSTGEARTREVLDENDGQLNCFVSAAEGVFLSLIQKHFPLSKKKREKGAATKRKRRQKVRCAKVPKGGFELSSGVIKISDDSSSDSELGIDSDFNSSPESLFDNDDVIFVDHTVNGYTLEEPARLPLPNFQKDFHSLPGTLEHVERMKQDLIMKVKELGKELPLNTLDELIDLFGGPDYVAEMTGRKGRVVRRADGSITFESRAEQSLSIDNINLKEKERFMNGEKLVAIISEASSSGISLQADRRVPNQRRRVHMTLELPWSADRAIQQFGRTHRSNQVSAPEYVFLISELAGERRFASIVAKRLESLGALTHGDRRATESRDFSKYNFENKYGSRALSKILQAILQQAENKVPPPKNYPGGDAAFFLEMKQGLISVGICCKEPKYKCVTVEKDCSLTKFLNRILGLEVHKQNSLFQYFTDTFDYLIEKDKKEGRYDLGILDLAPGVDEIYEESQEIFLTPGHPQDGQVVLYKISVDRGLKWEEAYEKSLQLTGPNDGFYISYKVRGALFTTLLAEQRWGNNCIVYKPNIGKQNNIESLDNLNKRYQRITADEAKEHWENQYDFSFKNCQHAVWNGACKQIEEGKQCFAGMRLRHYYMLCGALLRVWSKMAGVISDITSNSYLQIVRLRTKEKRKQVGIKIPENCVNKVLEELKRMDANVKRKREEAALAKEKAKPPPYHLLPPHLFQPQPVDITQPAQGAHYPQHFLQQDEVLDLTYSPPIECTSEVARKAEPGAPHFLPEAAMSHTTPHGLLDSYNFLQPYRNQPQSSLGHVSFPTQTQNEPLGHVSFPTQTQNEPLAMPLDLVQQPVEEEAAQQDINFKEILEEMLRTLNDSPQEDALSLDRQSVIQFGGETLASFWDAG
ncbi:protein strawberry notch homolog 2 isoform X2 [Pleurodeles waltl]|uniref:protein strawberry notch homolog 2 isoform X2 n=1 Tax=Pleurodeles waltl TaxID=8319 RepID=UPI00370982ED